MADKRVLKTQASVKAALLDILEHKRLSQVSVSELAAKAEISRSTFYCNYQNVQEVFEALIADFLGETRALGAQLRCKGCKEAAADKKVPFCLAVREAQRYRSVVREPAFLPALLETMKNGSLGFSALAPYLELGVQPSIAENLLAFQMSGCYTAAMSGGNDPSWEETQATIDAFIAGGMNAVREMKQI